MVRTKRENAKTLRQAEEAVIARSVAFVHEKASSEAVKDRSKMALAYFYDLLIEEYRRRGRSEYLNLTTAKLNMASFRPDARLCDIDRKFCADYAQWLQSECITIYGKPLAKPTAFSYF